MQLLNRVTQKSFSPQRRRDDDASDISQVGKRGSIENRDWHIHDARCARIYRAPLAFQHVETSHTAQRAKDICISQAFPRCDDEVYIYQARK